MKINFTTLFFNLYALLFFVAPLLMFHKTSEIFEFNKMLFIYFMAFIVLSLWIAKMIIYKRLIIAKSIFTIPLLIFLGSQTLSTIFSIDKYTSLFGYYGRFNGGLLSLIAYIILFFAFISNINYSEKASKLIRKLLKISMLSSFIVILWGLPGKFGYDLTCFVFGGGLNVDCWTDQFEPTVRMFSTLGQPNWLGAYLAIHFFIGLFFFLIAKKRVKLYIYSGYLFLVFVTTLFTKSRSAIGAIGVGLVLFMIYFFYKKRTSDFLKISRLKVGILTALVIIGLLIGKTGISRIDKYITFPTKDSSVSTESLKNETESLKPVSIDSNITDSYKIRQIVWQGGYSLGLQYPLFGTGVETFAYAYNFSRPMEHNATSEWNYVYNKAHNEFVNFFATTGTIGLLSYLLVIAIVLLQIKIVINDKKLAREDEILIIALIIGYITISITNFFGFSTTTINLFFYLIPAWIWIILYSNPSTEKRINIFSLDNNQKAYLIVPTLLTVCGSIYLVSYFIADIHYARGENLRLIQDYDSSQKELYSAYNLRKEHVYADKISEVLAQQTFLKALGSNRTDSIICTDPTNKAINCVDLSTKFMQEALRKSPKNVFYIRTKARNNFLYYQSTLNEKYFDEAILALRVARNLAPTDPRYPYTQALFHLARFENLSRPTQKDRNLLDVQGIGSVNFATKLKPDYREAYQMKGLIHAALNQKEQARSAFQYILDHIDPQDQQAKDELKQL